MLSIKRGDLVQATMQDEKHCEKAKDQLLQAFYA
jgi:hypothetical protein